VCVFSLFSGRPLAPAGHARDTLAQRREIESLKSAIKIGKKDDSETIADITCVGQFNMTREAVEYVPT
jgi:hypothetical protein